MEISQEVWDAVVKDSPYLHVSYELYFDEGEVELYADEAREEVIATEYEPNLYAKALGSWRKNPYKYFILYSAIHADEDSIGEFSYQERDLDTDYYSLEDTSTSIETMEDLISFLNTHIPEKVFKENNLKLVEGDENV